MNNQVYLSIGLGLCVASVFIFQAWRRGIYFIFVWLLLEDIIRRLLPGQPVEIQLVKEALVLETYIAFFITWRSQGRLFWSPPFCISLLAFSVIVLVDAFNPEIPGLFIPAAGIRSYLWYVPLLWVSYHAFRTRAELVRFSRFLLGAAVPLAALGVAQYFFWDRLPGWLQPLEGAHWTRTVAFEYGGEIVGFRSKLPSSVFGSAHRFAMFSLFLFFLGVGSWRCKLVPYGRSRRIVLGLCILAALVCIVVAGTRMGMGLTVVGLLLLIIVPVWKTEKIFLIRRTRIRQALALLVPVTALFGMLKIFSDTGTFFLYTTAGGVKEHWSQFTQGQLPNALTKASWVGFGTGALSQGLGHVPGGEEAFQFASRESEGVGVEYGLAKVAWELGVVGLALFLLLWGRIFWTLWTSLRAVRDPSIKGLSSALGTFLLLVFLAFLKGHYYLGDGTTLVLYWFGMGMSFSLVRLDRLEAARAQSMRVRA